VDLLDQLELDIQKNYLEKTFCLPLCQGEVNVIPPYRVFIAAVVFSSILATTCSPLQ